MNSVEISRFLTGMTLGVHIIFATIGVGMPLMFAIAEFLGIKKKDPKYIALAKRWSKGYTITVAVGVVTGTIIGLQLSLVWPTFMKMGGHVIALPLFMETFAFFFEAMFNSSFLVRAFHVVATAGMTMAFILAAIAAFKLLKNKYSEDAPYHKKALKMTMILGFIQTLLSMLAGDLSAKFLHKVQPEKLAAYEWHFDTHSKADLVFFGVLNENTQEVSGAIKIPGLLSFLADNNINTKVKGLNEFPKNDLPPLIVHYFFDLMVAMGIFCFIVSGIFILALLIKKLRPIITKKVMLYAVLLTGPASMLAIEFGWFLTEMGRQPWIVRGYMRVSQAATQAGGITLVTILFGLLYFVLLFTSAYVLLRMFRNKPAREDIDKVIGGQE